MKLLLSIGLLLVVGARAQDQNVAPAGKPKQDIEVAAPQAPKTSEVSTNALGVPKPAKEPKEPVVTYGGLMTDLRKSTNRWRIFSLRRPVNLKEDNANILREGLRTEASGAVKLFSVDF